ncbi:hypothetical protein GQX74_005101 [Glossina fuscipes]|nr:hypothetical protein GQX74_005101 [Glossina fuscipes]
MTLIELFGNMKNNNAPERHLEFYNTTAKPIFNVEDKVRFVTDPRVSNPYSQAYMVDCVGEVIGGLPALYDNQPVELLLNMGPTSLKAGEAVWFGCEVSKRFAFNQGIAIFTVDIPRTLCKDDRLIYGESSTTHAMLFTVVSLHENTSLKKLRLENALG